jgi:hypothetical protein
MRCGNYVTEFYVAKQLSKKYSKASINLMSDAWKDINLAVG